MPLCRAIPWDRGNEWPNTSSSRSTPVSQIYFCDPHIPWQRGTNENTNGLLRQYLPKGADLRALAGRPDAVAPELDGPASTNARLDRTIEGPMRQACCVDRLTPQLQHMNELMGLQLKWERLTVLEDIPPNGARAIRTEAGMIWNMVAGATFGAGALALGATTISATSAAAWALASVAGPLGSAADIPFKVATGQRVGASDGFGAIANMVPLPGRIPLQLGPGIALDQFVGAVGEGLDR